MKLSSRVCLYLKAYREGVEAECAISFSISHLFHLICG